MRLALILGLSLSLVMLGFRPGDVHAMGAFASDVHGGAVSVDCIDMLGDNPDHESMDADMSHEDMECLCSLDCMMLCGLIVVYIPPNVDSAASSTSVFRVQFDLLKIPPQSTSSPPSPPPKHFVNV